MILPAIECANLFFSYARGEVIRSGSCSIAHGELACLFGPNGGGKTTFLKLLMGFLLPEQGTIRIFQKRPEDVREHMGYVPQVFRTDLDFPITVKELIAMGRPIKRLFLSRLQQEDYEAANEWMEKLGLLEHQNKSYKELSGGLAQRALLARALIAKPKLLFLDEPTANVDSKSSDLFLQTLEELKGKITILLVTHDLKIAAKHATKLFCVQGTIEEIHKENLCKHFSLGLFATNEVRK